MVRVRKDGKENEGENMSRKFTSKREILLRTIEPLLKLREGGEKDEPEKVESYW